MNQNLDLPAQHAKSLKKLSLLDEALVVMPFPKILNIKDNKEHTDTFKVFNLTPTKKFLDYLSIKQNGIAHYLTEEMCCKIEKKKK